MLSVLYPFLTSLFSVFRSRAALQVEILAPWHQIGALAIVKPDTLVRWHRVFALVILSRLAIDARPGQTRDRHRLAPEGLSLVLDLESSTRNRRKADRVARRPGLDSNDENNKLKPAAELKAILNAAGVKPGDRVVSYCSIGPRATVIYFVARYLGYDARLYDGSWEEWNKHTELPTEVSAAK